MIYDFANDFDPMILINDLLSGLMYDLVSVYDLIWSYDFRRLAKCIDELWLCQTQSLALSITTCLKHSGMLHSSA